MRGKDFFLGVLLGFAVAFGLGLFSVRQAVDETAKACIAEIDKAFARLPPPNVTVTRTVTDDKEIEGRYYTLLGYWATRECLTMKRSDLCHLGPTELEAAFVREYR